MLAGSRAVVTGAARGIGFAVAERFAQEGAAVVIGDVDAAAAESAAERLEGTGASVRCVAGDVTSPEDVRRLVTCATDVFGGLDILVNNAGITRDASLRRMTLDDFRAVMDVHLLGAWLGTREAAAVMREQGGGAIVNVASISGKVGNPGQTNYSAAKAGIVGLTKAAAKELAPVRIRVNAVQPGLIRTQMIEAMRSDLLDRKLADVPMGRAGEPEEVATAVLFLASELASYITGAVLDVSGGRMM